MKPLICILPLLVSVLLGTATVCASQTEAAKSTQKPIGSQITQDEAVKQLDGTVEVSFKIDGSGKVQIVNMNATNPQLADYVIKKLSKIQLDRTSGPEGKIITYRFVFKKQA
jgi:hypothetical protein